MLIGIAANQSPLSLQGVKWEEHSEQGEHGELRGEHGNALFCPMSTSHLLRARRIMASL